MNKTIENDHLHIDGKNFSKNSLIDEDCPDMMIARGSARMSIDRENDLPEMLLCSGGDRMRPLGLG